MINFFSTIDYKGYKCNLFLNKTKNNYKPILQIIQNSYETHA